MFPNALRIRSLHGLGSLLQDFKVQYAAFYEDCEATFDFSAKIYFPWGCGLHQLLQHRNTIPKKIPKSYELKTGFAL